MKRCHVVSWLAVLGLAGCAVGPDYQTPASVVSSVHFPLDNRQVNESAPPDAWWHGFHDPVLDGLEQDALRQNLDLQSAWARIRQARAERNETAGAELPQVEALASESRDTQSLNSEGFSNIPTALVPHPRHAFNDYRIGFDASWELDVFGYDRRQVDAASARLGSVEEQAHAAALEVAAEVASVYIDYRALQARVALANRSADLAQEQWRLVTLAERAGLASQVEVAQWDGARQDAQAQVPPLIAAERAELDHLAVLLGVSPEALAPRLAASAPVPDSAAAVGVGLPSDLLRRRPDIRRAERDLAAASADIGVAVAAQYPRFTLVSSLGFDSIYPGQLTQQASRFWSFGPQLSLPIFAGGQLQNQVKAKQAAYDAQLASYRGTVLAALSDSETALIRFERESERLTRLAAARRAAQQSLDLARQRVAVGEVSNADALQAESQLQQASDLWTQSQAARADDLVSLYKALGGGWRQADYP